MALEMVALRAFKGQEGKIKRGQLFTAASQARFDFLQRYSIAAAPQGPQQEYTEAAPDTILQPLRLTGKQARTSHVLKHAQIEGEATEIVTLYREGEAYTVFQIEGPPNDQREATITLMRHEDPTTGGPEFIDFYNMGYDDGRQMGLRIQKRGSGQLLDFVIDFYDGAKRVTAVRYKPDGGAHYYGNQYFENEGHQLLQFRYADGTDHGHYGSVKTEGKERMVYVNQNAGSSFELFDNGNIIFYQPAGDTYFYSDTGGMYFNDVPVLVKNNVLLNSPDGATWKITVSNTGALAAAKV